MNHLSGYVQRKVGRIDDPTYKAQIARQDPGSVCDEEVFDVELDTPATSRIEKVERPRAGNEGQRGVFLRSLGAEMDRENRLVELAGQLR